MNPITVRKILRALRICHENRLPMVFLVESGGADLPHQLQLYLGAGEIFRDITALSAAGIPTVSLVFGNSTAGGAYLPGHQRLRRHGRPAGQGLPGRHAAGEDGHRRGRRRGGARWGAACTPPCRACPTTSRRDEHDAIRLGRQIVHGLTYRKLGSATRSWRRSTALRPRRDPRHRVGRPQGAVPRPRGARPGGGRLRVRRVQAQLRTQPGHRLRPSARLLGRHPGQRSGGPPQRGRQQGGPVHPAGQPGRHAAAVRPERHRVHGRAPNTSSGAWSSTGPTRSTRSPTAPCPI